MTEHVSSASEPHSEGKTGEPDEFLEADANAAASSPADDQDANQEAPNLLSVIQNAVAPAEQGSGAGSSDAEAQEGSGAEAQGPGAAEAEEGKEPDADVPFHNHPRWKQLTEERNAFKGDAENFRNIQTFMEVNGLSTEEVSEGYQVMALLKRGDQASLKEALEWFEPRVAYLREQVGNVLPDDLRERVEAGELDEADASELAQARATLRLNDEAIARQQERSEEQAKLDAQQQNAARMSVAVQGWEDNKKATDPDYAAKADLVLQMTRAIVSETGRAPTNEIEAIALADQAYARANETVKKFSPPPRRPITPIPSGTSAQARAAPDTLRGAIEQALSS